MLATHVTRPPGSKVAVVVMVDVGVVLVVAVVVCVVVVVGVVLVVADVVAVVVGDVVAVVFVHPTKWPILCLCKASLSSAVCARHPSESKSGNCKNTPLHLRCCSTSSPVGPRYSASKSLMALAVSLQRSAALVTTSCASGKSSQASVSAVMPDRSSQVSSVLFNVSVSASHMLAFGMLRC